jgi:hypothetical protein
MVLVDLFSIVVLMLATTTRSILSSQPKSNTKAATRTENDYSYRKCDLCHHNFTIILGTGRSGSSSLLGMLNQLPRYDLSGEHNGQLMKFKELYNDIQKVKHMKSYAWVHNNQDQHKFLCYVQQWYLFESGHKQRWVHGFKEIVSLSHCAFTQSLNPHYSSFIIHHALSHPLSHPLTH